MYQITNNARLIVLFCIAICYSTFFSVKEPLLGVVLLLGLCFLIVIIYFSTRKPIDIAIMMLFSALLLPPLKISSDFPAIRPEFFIVIIMFSSMVFSKGKLVIYKNPVNKWFLFFGICIMLSVLYGGVRGYSIGVRDFYEIIKLVIYWMMFYTGLQSIRKTDDIDKIIKWLMIFFALASLFGIGQLFNVANINTWLTPYYTNIEKYGMINEYGRAVGTVGNPNEFGILLTFGVLVASSCIFMNYPRKKLSYTVFVLTSLGILFTASRTALVGLIIGFVVLIIHFYPKYNRVKRPIGRTAMALVIVIPLGIVVLAIAPEVFFIRSQQLHDISGAASWTARLEMWKSAIEIFKTSPLLGVGPSKDAMLGTVDNEWLLLLRSYGIVGLTAFVCLFCTLYQRLSFTVKHLTDNLLVTYVITLEALMIVFAVDMIPAGVYHSMQIMPLYCLCLGIGLSLIKPSQ